MNTALARLAGVFAVALFVWLLAADDFGRDPVLVRAEDYCTVGRGPRQTRSRYVSQLLKRLARGDLAALRPLAEQRGFEERIVTAVAPWFWEEEGDFGTEVLALQGEPGLEVLRRALDSPDRDIATSAASALGFIDEPSPAVLELAFDHIRRDSPASAYLLNVLELWGASALPAFLNLVEQGRDENAKDAIPAITLEEIARYVGIDAAEPLARLFVRAEGEVRNRALYCTYALDEDAEPAVPILLAELGRCNENERSQIFEIVASTRAPLDAAAQDVLLAEVGPRRASHQYVLLGRCRDRKEAALEALRGDDSIEATFAVHALDGTSLALQERWREGLRSDDAETVGSTLYGLAGVGSDIEPLLADVAAVVSRADAWIDAMASGRGAAVPHLVPLLRSENAEVRVATMIVLDKIGHAARAAAPALIPLARSGNRKAWFTLINVDPANAAAIELIVEGMDSDLAFWWYSNALSCVIGPAARVAGPALRQRLAATLPGDGFPLGMALGALGEADAATVSRFRGQLGSSDPGRRRNAARVLFAIGRDAAPALPELRRARSDCSPRTALWATLATDAAEGGISWTLALLAEPARVLDVVYSLAGQSLVFGVRLDSRLVPAVARLARMGGARQEAAMYCLRGMAANDLSAADALRAILDDQSLPASARKHARESLASIE